MSDGDDVGGVSDMWVITILAAGGNYITAQGYAGIEDEVYMRMSNYEAYKVWVSHNAPEEIKELAHIRTATVQGTVFYI